MTVVRNREADAIRTLVELGLADPDPWLPEHAETLHAAALVAAEWCRRSGETPRPVKVAATPRRSEPWTSEGDYANARDIVWRRSRGLCEARTPDCFGRASQVHHTAGRGFAGCHHPDLLLAVCGNGNTTGCHGYIHADRPRAEGLWLLFPHGTRAPITIERIEVTG